MAWLPDDPLDLWGLLHVPEPQRVNGGKGFQSLAAPLGLRCRSKKVTDHDGDSFGFVDETFSGERSGRRVRVRPRYPRRGDAWGWGFSSALGAEASVYGAAPEFTARSEGGRLVSRDGDARVQAALAAVNAEREWKRYELRGGDNEIRADRKISAFNRNGFHEWVYDLWLVEELARRLDKPR